MDNAVEVNIEISVSRGVQVTKQDGEFLFCYELRNIPYCIVHDHFQHIFTFLGERDNRIFCHIFMFKSEKEARDIYQNMSKIFQQASIEQKMEEKKYKSRLSWYARERGFSNANMNQNKQKQRIINSLCVFDFDENGDETESLITEADVYL